MDRGPGSERVDLDALERQHEEEEASAEKSDLVRRPRPWGPRSATPQGLTRSARWLDRLYAGERMVREKKPIVVDHARSAGPWMVSIDEPPMSVLDGMSQTATLCGGFSEDPVVAAYFEGEFGVAPFVVDDTATGEHEAVEQFATTLRELVPGFPHVSFVNSGAEACEKALALCLANAASEASRQRTPSSRPDAPSANTRGRKILAFEGSFHGRTLLSLHCSYNPKKRAPFEIAGYEVDFVPFPVWLDPGTEPPCPLELLTACATGKLPEPSSSTDPQLAIDIASWQAVHDALSHESYFAVIVEPMQAEGGDRYATARFFRGLRVLTRAHGVPLIVDEVQTGFGLGGTFTWSERFSLTDAEGNPDCPDCIAFAKRAQVGVVMSRFPDAEPTSAHVASLIRGRVHAEWMASDGRAAEVEQVVRDHLERLAARFPDLVHHPRVTGYALAFDLPSPLELKAFLAQRFYRGAVVFGAGDRTVRYRLHRAYSNQDIDRVAQAIEASLEFVQQNPGVVPEPTMHDPSLATPVAGRDTTPSTLRIRVVLPGEEDIDELLDRVMELEARVYEPARRDSRDFLRLAFLADGLVILAETKSEAAGADQWRLVGSIFGTPLERARTVAGPDRDPFCRARNTLYSIASTVDPAFHGQGIGTQLKAAQIESAQAFRWPSGARRFLHIAGRNRLGATDAMMHINRSFGAYEVFRLENAYESEESIAIYYRIPVGPPSTRHIEPAASTVDVASLSRPLQAPPASLSHVACRGALYGPTVNKITLCNYVTPAVVRAVEWVSALTPDHPHLYLTSSRDEATDKSLRILRAHRPDARIAIGLAGGYLGHTTAAARSLSDPSVHRQGPAYFDNWRLVPHPADNASITISAIEDIVAQEGADRILGLFIEPLQERTGATIPDSMWNSLERLRQRGVPVVLVETASAHYRSGRGAFYSSGIDFVPDLMAWWGGGQIGFVHTTAAFFVPTPLTMVSTWDGDELSLIRVHHQLRAARRLDVSYLSGAFDECFADLPVDSIRVRGTGAFRVLDAGKHAPAFAAQLARQGFIPRVFPNDHVAIVPPLDLDPAAIAHLMLAIKDAVHASV